jgi:hypothetical protein
MSGRDRAALLELADKISASILKYEKRAASALGALQRRVEDISDNV